MLHDSQYAVAFACHLVEETLGEAPKDVCACLLKLGQQSLVEIVRHVQRPLSVVQKALLVLLQHNYADVYLRPEESDIRGTKPACHLYDANMQAILQTIRKPKFLLHIRGEMSEVAEAIIEVLLVHGRLRLDQITSSVSSKFSAEGGGAASVDGVAVTSSHVQNVFMSLLNSHYIERAPPANLTPPLRKTHPNAVKARKAAPKPGSREYAEYQAEQLRLQRGPDALYAKHRYTLPSHMLLEGLGLDSDEDEGGNVISIKRKRQEDGTAGQAGGVGEAGEEDGAGQPAAKRQRVDASTAQQGGAVRRPGERQNGGVQGSADEEERNTLWRVNLDEFNRRFRHQACVGVITDKLNKDAGTVLAAMLAVSRAFETALQQDMSQPLGEEEIAARLHKLCDTGALPQLEGEADVASIIMSIAKLSLGFVERVGQGPAGTLWQVNLTQFINTIRMRELESVVRGRYGVEGLRIFRLLLLHGQLEQKQVGDFAMLPQKETRELVFRMAKGGVLQMQDIPRGSDRAPAKTFYTFSVNVQAFADKLGADMYKAAFNLQQRLKYELAQHKEVMELVEGVKETGRLERELTAAQGREIERLRNVGHALDVSLLHLDEMIAIFNDY